MIPGFPGSGDLNESPQAAHRWLLQELADLRAHGYLPPQAPPTIEPRTSYNDVPNPSFLGSVHGGAPDISAAMAAAQAWAWDRSMRHTAIEAFRWGYTPQAAVATGRNRAGVLSGFGVLIFLWMLPTFALMLNTVGWLTGGIETGQWLTVLAVFVGTSLVLGYSARSLWVWVRYLPHRIATDPRLARRAKLWRCLIGVLLYWPVLAGTFYVGIRLGAI